MNFIEDRLEISELTARYSYYVDTFKTDKIVSLWTDDAVFDESRVGTGLHKGIAAIRTFFEVIETRVTHQAHLTSAQFIEEIDGKTAKGIVFASVEAVTAAGNMRAVIYYADDYVKQNGRWLFRLRVIHPLLPFDTSAFEKAK